MNEREALRPMRDGPAPEGVGGRLVRGLRRLLRRLRRRRRQRAAYRRWIAARDRGVEEAVEPEGRGADTTFSVLVPWTEGRWEDWIRSLTSVRRQRHPHWELCIAADARTLERLGRDRRWPADGDGRCRLITVPHGSDPAAAANSALETCSGRFVIHLPATGRLAPRALSSFAAAVRERPDVRMLYADEDRIDWRGRRRDPSFKCEFNHTLLLTHDCLSHPLACARDLAVAIGGWRAETGAAMHHDFALRCVEQVERRQIVHVPEVLHHRRADFATMAEAAAAGPAGRAAVAGHLARLGIAGSVESAPEAGDRLRVRFVLPSPPPLVSIAICTRDNARMLGRCLATLRDRTRYPAYEIIIVDNGSRDAATLDLLASLMRPPGVVVVRADGPFNFSRLNNMAVARARGDVVCLLNDDTEVLTPGWLDEMVGFALMEGIGAVGARLWYPDATLQHGGVVLDPEVVATHAFARYPRGDTGYARWAVIQREVSAVTAACLVVRRDRYDAIGGLDERFAVAFNDVDLCLRLRERGWRTVWTPYAELIHHESVSRGRDDRPEKRERFERELALMRDRWSGRLAADPCYGPHFSSRWADCSLAPR
jgi:GT2 family glycosyltransferase